MSAVDSPIATRLRARIAGQVQGVGFRPHVYRLAEECQLTGFVGNDSGGVFLEIQGLAPQLECFRSRLLGELPVLARIDRVAWAEQPTIEAEPEFRIQPSRVDGEAHADVTPDAAICPDCRREILDPTDRRFAYALTNCTNCGPRYTIVHSVPYDRSRTSMQAFALCESCATEFANPLDRRHHAQPTACAECGPRVEYLGEGGGIVVDGAIALAARELDAGRVLAIKGLGGYHLACRADQARAVRRLRDFKQRDQKPMALLVPSIDRALEIVDLSAEGLELLSSPAAPIVLGRRRPSANVADEVAPGLDRLGVMLAYTPLHVLLFERADTGFSALVMTSANLSDEPLIIDDAEIEPRLGELCDGILRHERPIVRPVDDSVVLDRAVGHPIMVRRSRGYVPAALDLSAGLRGRGIAIGADLKSVAAILRGQRAICGPHLGDRIHAHADAHARVAVRDLLRLFDLRPEWIAHDLHPAYESTRHALQLGESLGIPCVGVQHHHAHAASVLAEHREPGPAIAIVCDGMGYGDDASIWGGELLRVDFERFDRLGHLKPLSLIGGDAAARDPRRSGLAMLASAVDDSLSEHSLARRMVPDPGERAQLCAMLDRGVQCVPSSGAGRWFDAFAALLGVSSQNQFESQAAMALETAARRSGESAQGDETWISVDPVSLVLDPTQLVGHVVEELRRGTHADTLARLFHTDLASALARAAGLAAERTQLDTVVLCGGVFLNELLATDLRARLDHSGLRVLEPRRLPPGDGGLALGQLAIASARHRANPQRSL